MERLTMIDGCGNDELARCMDCGLEKAGADLENCGMCEEGWQRALKRLAAYEDTGLEPEEIADFMKRWEWAVEIAGLCKNGGIDHLMELKKAEQDGRLVVLPCKEYVGRNEPLTLDELRKMDGEPVWIVAGDVSWWDIVSFSVQDWLYLARGEELRYSRYGEWLAYRQKPEEGTV